ncbi:MAG: LptF/LptG family permease [Maricaulaceae bacterium]
MGRLNQYLLKKALISIGGLIVFAIVVLLLERLLRIFEIVSNSSNPAGDAGSMVINLLPHYLGMAVPMALLLGVIITIDQFSRSSELTAALGAGVSLTHMTKPFMFIAAFLAVATLFIEGYMQPVGRYNYRQVVHVVKQQSFTAALREGTFTNVGNRTFFAGTEKPGAAIGPIFIYEKLSQGGVQNGVRITTADEGRLKVRDNNDPVLQLAEGQTYQIRNKRQLNGDLSFESSAVAGTVTENIFRSRGDDERELTSIELFKNRNGSIFETINQDTNNAALHLRLGRAMLLLILPFIAVPFGLNYGRNPSSAGIFIGIVLLVSLQKALEFGQSLGASGIIPPWAGIWPIISIVGLFAIYIFRKSAFKMGQPPLTTVAFHITAMRENLTANLISFKNYIQDQRA